MFDKYEARELQIEQGDIPWYLPNPPVERGREHYVMLCLYYWTSIVSMFRWFCDIIFEYNVFYSKVCYDIFERRVKLKYREQSESVNDTS